jgi:hypothetical protein
MAVAQNMLALAQNMTQWWSKQKSRPNDGLQYEYQDVLDRYWNLQAADDATIIASYQPAVKKAPAKAANGNRFIKTGGSCNQSIKRWHDSR